MPHGADRGYGGGVTGLVDRVRTVDLRDALVWGAVALGGLLLARIGTEAGWRVGLDAAPFAGLARRTVSLGSVLAPLVAAAVVVAVRRGLAERLPWRRLLAAAWLAAFAWCASLALVDGGHGFTTLLMDSEGHRADVAAIGDDWWAFLGEVDDRPEALAVGNRTHPPGPVLLLWGLDRAGVDGTLPLGILLTSLAALVAPLVTVATRSLCGERAARRLLPALVLAPYAVWSAGSLDGVTAALAAGAVAVGLVASEPGRTPRWPIAAGVLLGVAALFSFPVVWLAAIPLLGCFLRRRGTTIAFMGTGAVMPLALAQTAGYDWAAGLGNARADWTSRVGAQRGWLLWLALDVVALAVACGPLLVTAARKVRNTPGWPVLVGAGLGLAFTLAVDLARGEVEHSWLPFMPWLLVPASAPAHQGGDPERLSTFLLVLGATTAVVVRALVQP